MMSPNEKKNASQEFLDSNQYSQNSILTYERIFGHTWVSTGGELTTKEFCIKLGLSPGQKVLDIGCGTGGSAFFLARQYGTIVEGIDLSKNMIAIALDRLARDDELIKNRISFRIADATKVEYPKESFDLIYSRDTILHIADKEALFRRILLLLKPGGKLLISDYCRGDQEHSQVFLDYVKERGYHLKTVKEYGATLERAGFKQVEAIDMSQRFIEILENELKYFKPTKEAFIKDFNEKHYADIVSGWTSKIERVKAGDQAWGLFYATK